MTSEEFLSRMDARLERIDAQGERLDAHMERNGELLDAVVHEHQLNREAYGQLVRMMMSVIDKNARAFDRSFKALDDMRAEIRAQTAEIRARTEAIFRVIDRLDGGASAASA